MEQSERREILIRYLLQEDEQYKSVTIPASEDEQRRLLRALLNVRPPRPIDSAFLEVQDAYLAEMVRERGIVPIDAAEDCGGGLYLWQGDITRLAADAIVNAANSGMTGCYVPNHSCIDNIIHTQAGIELRLKCSDIMLKQGHEEPTGSAKITPAYNLPSQYVLHTVGPIIENGRPSAKQREQLASCYRACLELASASGCKSIAFCCISTGVFLFPNRPAAEIAVKTVKNFLAEDTRIERVIFNVFKDLDKEIYQAVLGAN